MDFIIGVFFFVFAFFCMIFALYEERDTNSVGDDEETKSDNLIVILLGAAVVLFFISAACMLTASESYYSSVTDTMVEHHLKAYEPLAYLPIGFAIFNLLLASIKGFSLLGKYYQDGT